MQLHRLTTNAFHLRRDWPIQYWMMLTPLILAVVVYFLAVLSLKTPIAALTTASNDTQVVSHITGDWEQVPVVVIQSGGGLMATLSDSVGDTRIVLVDLPDLTRRARLWQKSTLPTRTYLIVDEDVPYARVDDVLHQLRLAGRDQVLFMTRPFSI